MSGAVAICNDALNMIGKANINDLGEPSPEARQCNRVFNRTLRELQSRFDWEFTLTVKDITAETAASNMPGYKYAHKLPPDYLRLCTVRDTEDSGDTLLGVNFSPAVNEENSFDALQLRSVYSQTQPTNFRIVNGKVHTNFTPIRLLYHRFDDDVGNVQELFRSALIGLIAARICFPLTRDTKLTESVRTEAREALLFAQDEEGKDEYTETPTGSSFEDARI